MRTNLDMSCLRTFVTISDVGSFAEAALRVGRTAPAVSLQISRLEQQVGAKLFRKSGRRMIPNQAGEQLLSTARRILEMNDQVVENLNQEELSGVIEIGAIQDIADSVLPSILARFREAHPRVRIAARVDRSKVLAEATETGILDLAIGVEGWSNRPYQKIRRDRMAWLGRADFVLTQSEPVPLVVFEPPCSFRDAAIKALTDAGREWQIVFTSPSLSGLRAAVEAGLGITVRTTRSFQGTLRPLPKSSCLPKLPSVGFALYKQPDLTPHALRLCEIVVDELRNSG
jgi:DNA-binding transcriptional LysR family regulator